MSSVSKKVVLITGASSGIGTETAVEFSKLGSKVVLCGRNEENLESTAKKCHDVGLASEDVLIIKGDVRVMKDLEHTVQHTVKHFGQLDILINNAGILVTGGIEETSMEDYDKQMDINVRSVFYLTQLAIPHLIETKGNIVNVSSVAGLRSFPGIAAYCMSKAAIDQMTRCVALELAAKGVRVNAVNPGVIVTDIHKRAGLSESEYQEFLEHCKTTHALGRVGTSSEVAKSIVFLASEEHASFITGVTLSVDGGRGVMCPR